MAFPIGADVTVAALDEDPHPLLATLREREPVSWVPALEGWLVTRYALVLSAMRTPQSFTVDDPRFSTARIIGPSMLSRDGEEHARHRAPFVAPFRAGAVGSRFGDAVRHEATALIDRVQARGRAELRREFAGPLAAATVARALGISTAEVPALLGFYDEIVAAVTAISAGRGPGRAGSSAFAELRTRLEQVLDGEPHDSLLAAASDGSTLTRPELASNAAVLLFGGIETTEGMIANAMLALLRDVVAAATAADPALLAGAIEESLRLEPAAAVVDRYATADVTLGGVAIAQGDLVRLSIAGANRDPAVFDEPDRFDSRRANARRHLAFAHGPHVCVGVHLARLEARTAVRELFARLPNLRLDSTRPACARGLVFRKPPELQVIWDT